MKKSISILSILLLISNSCRQANDGAETVSLSKTGLQQVSIYQKDSIPELPSNGNGEDPPPRKDQWPWFNIP